MGEKGIFSYVALNLKKMFKDITSGDKERFKNEYKNSIIEEDNDKIIILTNQDNLKKMKEKYYKSIDYEENI